MAGISLDQVKSQNASMLAESQAYNQESEKAALEAKKEGARHDAMMALINAIK